MRCERLHCTGTSEPVGLIGWNRTGWNMHPCFAGQGEPVSENDLANCCGVLGRLGPILRDSLRRDGTT